MTRSQTVHDAATVILTRDRPDGGYEVFLARRHRNQSFMGGAAVFPGGRLDEADGREDLWPYITGLSAPEAREKLQEPYLTDHLALGLFMAAVRETFEEAGVLYACDSEGRAVDLADPAVARRFAGYRRALQESRGSLRDIAVAEGIRYCLGQLVPYARWITPTEEPKRFDTRFFIAKLPARQEALHDDLEMTASLWGTPASVLDRHQAREILLMPPTLKTVEEMSRFGTTDHLLAHANGRRKVPVLPQIFIHADEFGVFLPHDPEYTLDAYAQTPRPGEPSRVVKARGQVWRLEGA